MIHVKRCVMGLRWMVALGLLLAGAGCGMKQEPGGTEAENHAAAQPGAQETARPRVSFFGIESEGERVVFILDHSGSMIENLHFLKQEVRRSVEALRPTQRFGVVFFSELAEVMGGGKELLPATEENKKAILKEMDKVGAYGTSDDMSHLVMPQAFTEALALAPGPDVVFFLTDGHFHPKVVESVREINTKKACIHTLAFVNDKEKDYIEQLKEIARQNGGKFRFVAERDLGKGWEGK